MLVNWHDHYVGSVIERYGEYSYLEADFLLRMLRPGCVVVNAGANIGALMVPFALAVGAGGAVLAFEPQRELYYVLCANVALRGWHHVFPYQMALGATRGDIKVPSLDMDVDNSFGGLQLGAESPLADLPGYKVPIKPLDDLGLKRLDLLQADVEGMELDVLRGAEDTIARLRPALYLEATFAAKRPALLEWLERHGYLAWWHTPPMFNPENIAGVAENVIDPPDGVSQNWICLHRSTGTILEGERVTDQTI
jgi:FkbM family methyltransferase